MNNLKNGATSDVIAPIVKNIIEDAIATFILLSQNT